MLKMQWVFTLIPVFMAFAHAHCPGTLRGAVLPSSGLCKPLTGMQKHAERVLGTWRDQSISPVALQGEVAQLWEAAGSRPRVWQVTCT